MRFKTVFTFTLPVARQIRRLAEYTARQDSMPVDTQAFLNRLIARAYQEMENEQEAARKLHRCKICGEIYAGSPACPKCGEWNS